MVSLKLIRTALTWLGVAGVGITSWLSVKCSKKADEQTDSKKKLMAYAPAIASGVVTSACILGSHHLSGKEIAALSIGCACATQKSQKLEQYIRDKYGDKELKIARTDSGKDIVPWEGPSIEWTGKGNTLCMEGFSGRLFYSSKKAVEEAQEKFNERRKNEEYLSLNDLYELYGIAKTHFGYMYGWPAGGEYGNDPVRFVNKDDVDEHGEKIILIDIFDYPMECWMEV